MKHLSVERYFKKWEETLLDVTEELLSRRPSWMYLILRHCKYTKDNKTVETKMFTYTIYEISTLETDSNVFVEGIFKSPKTNMI